MFNSQKFKPIAVCFLVELFGKLFLSTNQRVIGQVQVVRHSGIFLFLVQSFNPLSANPTKWSNTLKQFVD